MEFFRELHQTQRLSVSLGVGHPEVAPEILFRVATTLVADDHHRFVIETSPPTDDRSVLAKISVAVQLDEVREAQSNVVFGERTLVASCDLDALERREILVNLLAKLSELLLERRDLLGDVQLLVPGEPFELVDLLLELGQRPLEVQCRSRHPESSRLSGPANEANALAAEQRSQLIQRRLRRRELERSRAQACATAIAVTPLHLERRRARL